VFLSSLSTQNSIHLATYLYTNSKQDNSTFKCEGGWRLTAYSWWLAADGIQLVAGGWAVASGGWAVTAGGCKWWLPSLTF
jgi:hypothetical protein